MTPERWFVDAIGQGLARLVALSLPNQPPAETIQLTHSAWADALWRNRSWSEADRARIAEGFRLLSARVDRWPAPKGFLELLPPRPEAPKLPGPVLSAAEKGLRASVMKRMKDVLGKP